LGRKGGAAESATLLLLVPAEVLPETIVLVLGLVLIILVALLLAWPVTFVVSPSERPCVPVRVKCLLKRS